MLCQCLIGDVQIVTNRLTEHRSEKILIQLDTELQHYQFTPDKHILNKIDVFTEIPVTPLNVLLPRNAMPLSTGKDQKVAIFLMWFSCFQKVRSLTMDTLETAMIFVKKINTGIS